ncbi:MAG: hypothetical protein ACM3X7_01165 [Solirubrobacterales bacterium]
MKSKRKKPVFSIILFVASGIIAVLGTALLVSNVMLYSHNVTQYVAQGYSIDTVTAQLLPSQLIPGVLEPVCVYYGIALLLAAAGIINQKLTKLTAEPVIEEDFEPAFEAKEVPTVLNEHHHPTEVIEDKETIDECISELEDDK